MSLRTSDQRFIKEKSDTEVKITRRYVALLEKHAVKATLYVCGKCFTEEWDDLKPVVSSSLVEIGGHQYRARQPRGLFDWYGRLTGNWNGPRWFQKWDISRTIRVCERRTGDRIVSWRGHSYKIDPNTYSLLFESGIQVVSDEVRATESWPKKIPVSSTETVIPKDLISHPLNVIPDHDHLYHAHRTASYVSRVNTLGYGADEFGAVSYKVEEWGDLVLRQVAAIEEVGGIATILAHPLCMYLADGFKTLEKLLESFSDLDCLWAREITSLVEARTEEQRSQQEGMA
jgi:hypothetical protein